MAFFLTQEKQCPSSTYNQPHQQSNSRSHTLHPSFRITQQSIVLQVRARTSQLLSINTRMSIRSSQYRSWNLSGMKGFGIRACRECFCSLTHRYIWILGRRGGGVGQEDESKTWSGDWDYTCVVGAVDGGYVESTAETTIHRKVTT